MKLIRVQTCLAHAWRSWDIEGKLMKLLAAQSRGWKEHDKERQKTTGFKETENSGSGLCMSHYSRCCGALRSEVELYMQVLTLLR